jgi:hypothetical protein
MGLFIHVPEYILDGKPGIFTQGMREHIHEIEVHGVDQGSLIHPKTTFLEGFLLGRRFV